jgi:hypothetical protein
VEGEKYVVALQDAKEHLEYLKGKEIFVNGIPVDIRPIKKPRLLFALEFLFLLSKERDIKIEGAKIQVEKDKRGGYRIQICLKDKTKIEGWMPQLEGEQQEVYLFEFQRKEEEEEYVLKEELREKINEYLPRLFPKGRLARMKGSLCYDESGEPFSSQIAGEEEISLDDLLEPVISYANTPIPLSIPKGETSERVFGILMNKNIRSSRREEITEAVERELRLKIEMTVKSGEPLKLVWLGFPFKNPDELITFRQFPDLNEIMGLAWLIRITRTVQQIYPPGIEWIILWEGNAYKDILNIPPNVVEGFLTTLKMFLWKFFWDNEITFVDLARITTGTKLFRERFKEKMEEKEVSLGELRKYFPVMSKAVSKERDLRFPILDREKLSGDVFSAYDREKTLEVIDATRVGTHRKELQKRIANIALDKAIKYMVFHEVKNKLGVVQSFVQETDEKAVYVSVTDKVGRYAFHFPKRNVYLPQHGVPVIPEIPQRKITPPSLLHWENIQFFNLTTLGKKLIAVRVRQDPEKSPFFFLAPSF